MWPAIAMRRPTSAAASRVGEEDTAESESEVMPPYLTARRADTAVEAQRIEHAYAFWLNGS
jgi:hypothetical protein